MITLSNKALSELDKIIYIAESYRDNTISKSMFYDVVYSLKEKDDEIIKYKAYLFEKGINIIDDTEDVEEDDEKPDDTVAIKPYDPSNIDISPKPITLDSIIARLENEEIDLMPDFQRKSGLWTEQQKSQLIESLILRIPLPAFYFDGSHNDRWIVIDGLQRLTAIKEFFVDKTLQLSGLEFMKDLNRVKYDDMPRAYIRRMKETQIISYIINPGAPINLKYNIFKRINTGGLRLEPQEIRHALYQGFASQYLKDLADITLFKEATGYSIRTDRMLDREFVLRFIAFYDLDESTYKGSIETFLNSAMEWMNKEYTIVYSEKVKVIFKKVLKLNIDLFGQFSFRKMPDEEKRRPINKALFETWMTVLARLSDDDMDLLRNNRRILIEKYMSMYWEDKEFVDSLSSAKVYSVRKRFEKITVLVEGVLEFAEQDKA